MPGPEYVLPLEGAGLTWEQIVFKISTGAWTMDQAVANTAMGYKALRMRLLQDAANKSLSPVVRSAARQAVQSLARQAAASAGAGVASAGAATGVVGFFQTVGGWLGLTGAAATAAGVLATTVVLGGLTYGGARLAGSLAGDKPIAPGPLGTPTRVVCPPKVNHKDMCPWGPGGDYFVGECGPGFCWDGGGHGTGACKPIAAPPNSRRSYTRDVFCADGFTAVVDPCTGVIMACN